MTRQWLAAPEKMCFKHRAGEHVETHMFLSKMRQGHSLNGFETKSMFFGADYIKYRHDLIAASLKGHYSPLDVTEDMKARYPLIIPQMDDLKTSLLDLLGRCEDCYNLHSQAS